MEINGLTPLRCFQICNSCSVTAELPSEITWLQVTSIVPIPHKFCRNLNLTGKRDSKALQLSGLLETGASFSPFFTFLEKHRHLLWKMNSPIEVINTAHTFSVYLFCGFFPFFSQKWQEPHLQKKAWSWNGTVACYCKNITGKLVHSSNSKLHMDSGLI